MLKEAAWTAKFIRRQREEEAEELQQPCAHHVHIMGPPCSHKSELVTSAEKVTKHSSKCSLRSMDSDSDSIAYNCDCDIL
jgi:hypothetical protein